MTPIVVPASSVTVDTAAVATALRALGWTVTPPAPRPATNFALSPFAAASPWNTPLPLGTAYLGTSAATTMLRGFGGAMNCETWSHPVYQAAASDPMATVVSGGPSVQYRIPAGATPALPPWGGGYTDAHLHVIDPTGRWLDECWQMQGGGTSWQAGYHVRTDLTGPGVGQGGVRAYGGSAVGGLIRSWEVKAGVIHHALAVALSAGQLATGPVAPATSEDSGASASYTGLIHMGTRVAIPRSVVLSSLGLSQAGLMVATALQVYGALVVDTAGACTLYAEPTGGMDLSAVAAIRRDMPIIVGQLSVVVPLPSAGAPR